MDELAALAAEVCDVPMAFVSLVDERREWFKARVGLEITELPRGGTFSDWVIEHGDLLVVPDVPLDLRTPANPLLAVEPGVRFFAGVPLVSEDGQRLGALGVMDRVPRGLSESQEKALRRLGRLAMLHLETQSKTRELIGSERRLRAIIENEPECVKLLGPDCELLEMNPAGLRMIEADSLAQVVGHSVLDLVMPEHRAAFSELAARVGRGESGSLKFEIQGLKGGRRWLEIHAVPLRDDCGEFVSLLGITRDISGWMRSQALLDDQRQTLERIASGAPLEVTLLDLTQFIEAQSAGLLCSVLLLDPDGVHLRHGAAPSLAEAFSQAIDGAPIGDRAGSCGTAAFRREPVFVADIATDPLWSDYRELALGHGLAACWSTPIFDEQRRVLGTFAIYYRTPGLPESEHLKLIEIATHLAAIAIGRHREGEALRHNYALLDAVMEGSTDIIFVKDLAGRYQFINSAGARFVELAPSEIIGRTDAELFSDEMARHFRETDKAVMAAGEARTSEEFGTVIGRVRVFSVNKAPWRDAKGAIRGIIGVTRDITERRKLEQQSLRSQRMESIGTLAGGIAHDLNNALGPILMSLDLLKLKFPDRASHELLDIIGASAGRGADMVRQVLSFARGVEGRREEVQVSQLLQEVGKIVNDTFLKNIAVKLTVAPDLWSVVGDPTQLHQVLLNLCVNARDAMPYGGRLALTAENVMLDSRYVGMHQATNPGPHISIRVEDNGTGIPANVLENIFDPFFTTKEIGKGTGLGLSTSLAIVKSHGGFIQVYSEEGKGTTFNVYLPAHADASPPTTEPASDLPRGHGELILVIDDEVLVGHTTQKMLEAFGYRVLLAVDGADGVAVYAGHQDEIAVVITDMMMPVMDGPATIQVLKRMNPAVRTIATSGLSSTDHMKQVARLGVNGFLAKPYTAQILLKELKVVIDGSRTSPR